MRMMRYTVNVPQNDQHGLPYPGAHAKTPKQRRVNEVAAGESEVIVVAVNHFSCSSIPRSIMRGWPDRRCAKRGVQGRANTWTERPRVMTTVTRNGVSHLELLGPRKDPLEPSDHPTHWLILQPFAHMRA